MGTDRSSLRHALATLAYRAHRVFEDAPQGFADFDGAGRRPADILAHMGDLLDWSLSIAQGRSRWHRSEPLEWAAEQQRFFDALGAFDSLLASDAAIEAPVERLLQGPVIDALTHVGQLAMLRRLAGCPTRKENFYVADIVAGRVGADQPEPVMPL